MNRVIATVFLLMFAAGVGAGAVLAQQPLYDPQTGASLFTNLKAYGVGDVVTIVIRENTVASSTATTETENTQETKGGPGTGILGFMDIWGLNYDNTYTGDGSTERTGSLISEMTAQLVERLPNGQFRIEGQRSVRINGEFETIRVSGVIRARDIGPDNKVLSTNIANARIVYEGEGDVGQASSPGLFTKIVNFLF